MSYIKYIEISLSRILWRIWAILSLCGSSTPSTIDSAIWSIDGIVSWFVLTGKFIVSPVILSSSSSAPKIWNARSSKSSINSLKSEFWSKIFEVSFNLISILSSIKIKNSLILLRGFKMKYLHYHHHFHFEHNKVWH